jgi:hypothetical protein
MTKRVLVNDSTGGSTYEAYDIDASEAVRYDARYSKVSFVQGSVPSAQANAGHGTVQNGPDGGFCLASELVTVFNGGTPGAGPGRF